MENLESVSKSQLIFSSEITEKKGFVTCTDSC